MRRRRRRGGALVAALATLAFSAALGAALADLARTELRLGAERRMTARLLGALDACVADVTGALPAGWDFAALLAGADGTLGSADDGMLAAPADCTAVARAAPGGPVPDRIVIRAEARIGGARRHLDALVRRAPEPGAGGLLWLSAPPEAGAFAGTATIDGGDPDAPLASLAAPADPDALDAWIAGEGTHLDVSPGTLAPVTGPVPPLDDLRTRVLAAPHAGSEALVASGAPAAVVAYVAGDLDVADARAGAGLLFVDGRLDVGGTLEFHGVIVATGGIRVASGAGLTLDGELWLGVGGSALTVEGALVLRRAPGAVAAADALLPLPRRAVVAGARDVG